jgi:hypothetical protein
VPAAPVAPPVPPAGELPGQPVIRSSPAKDASDTMERGITSEVPRLWMSGGRRTFTFVDDAARPEKAYSAPD